MDGDNDIELGQQPGKQVVGRRPVRTVFEKQVLFTLVYIES